MSKKTFKQYLLELTEIALEEELEKQEQLMKHVYDSLSKLDEEELEILSVTPSNKSDMAIVIRFDSKDAIEKARPRVKKSLKGTGVSIEDRVIPKYDSSIECSEIAYSDGSGRVYVVYKYDIGSREGLALEHVVGLVLTGKVTDELKNRLNLPPDASKDQVKNALKSDFADVLHVALKGKQMIEDKIGKVLKVESEGSRNSKADLIMTAKNGKKYGLSIKLVTEEGREVRFTYNKNLGYGDEQEENLVRNPSGEAWWIVGRKIFAKKLGRKYSPGKDEFEPPSWMEKAKENKKDLYKESMEEVYEQMRSVFVDNLRRMKLKDLVEMVNEAHFGGEEEQEYDTLLVLSSDVEGINLKEQEEEQPDIVSIKERGLTKSDLVTTEGAKIIIAIPGMEELIIHGLKFHSNMLSSKRDDLKIKTR